MNDSEAAEVIYGIIKRGGLVGETAALLHAAKKLNQSCWHPIEKAPDDLRPILGFIQHQDDLGFNNWFEVVYCDDEGPKSFSGSTTFDNGEQCRFFMHLPDAPAANPTTPSNPDD